MFLPGRRQSIERRSRKVKELGFEGRVAVITGAGGGLGRSHALELADRGARVVVNDLGGSLDGSGSDASAARIVAEEIIARGGEAVANHDSVATPEGGAAIVQQALDAFGRVDIVINNAGILRDKSFHNMTPELIDPVLDVHLKGAFNVTRPAYEWMRRQSYGRILSTASAAGVFGNFGQANYGAAKMGLVGLARVLATEGARNNIKSNVIVPVAKSRMTESLMGDLVARFAPEFVSRVAAWLVHDECPVSGELYSVGAGHVARIFLGETRGWTEIDESKFTVEAVRDHFEQIRAEDGYAVPNNVGDEIALILSAIR
jgi:NAD(P)-dependent dehydrogenase (short-subunit alcohol dehydrogenase family)